MKMTIITSGEHRETRTDSRITIPKGFVMIENRLTNFFFALENFGNLIQAAVKKC